MRGTFCAAGDHIGPSFFRSSTRPNGFLSSSLFIRLCKVSLRHVVAVFRSFRPAANCCCVLTAAFLNLVRAAARRYAATSRWVASVVIGQ